MVQRIKYAVQLAKIGNFRRAARLLDISQPQLTRLIQSLETELGLALFDRSRSGVTTTVEGRKVLRAGEAFLKAEESFYKNVERIRRESSEVVRLVAGAFAVQSWAPAAIAAFTESESEASISVHEVDWWKLVDALLREEADLAIGEVSEAEQNPELVVERFPFRRGSIIVRSSHDLTDRKALSLPDIALFPLAAPRLPARIAQHLPPKSSLGHLSSDARFFVPTIECATPRAITGVVAGSNAVGFILPQFCAAEIKDHRIVELPLHPTWLGIQQGLFHRQGKPLGPMAQAFCRAARTAERRFFETRQR